MHCCLATWYATHVRASPKAWACRLCSEAGSSKDNPLAPEQVPSSIGATSTGTSATACYDEHTVMSRAALDCLAWSWAGPATRHNFCPRAPAGAFSQLKGETWNQGRVR